jgi:hypothetical protein
MPSRCHVIAGSLRGGQHSICHAARNGITIISTVHSIPVGLAEPFVRARSGASGTPEGRAGIRRPDDEATTANIGAQIDGTCSRCELAWRARCETPIGD